MDIQKEREAFEAYFKDKYPELYKDVFNEDGDDRAIIGYSFAWSAWQAKAQAVPEGFVVVPRELPHDIAERLAKDRVIEPMHENDPVWSEIAEKVYQDNLKAKKWDLCRDYKAMIEAQEPTND